jgi:hypothetical protein
MVSDKKRRLFPVLSVSSVPVAIKRRRKRPFIWNIRQNRRIFASEIFFIRTENRIRVSYFFISELVFWFWLLGKRLAGMQAFFDAAARRGKEKRCFLL